jgi:hypothetical protein
MRILGYVWSVLVESVVVIVVLGVFHIANSPFEVVVASGLTASYFAIVWNATMLARAQAQSTLALAGELVLVRRLLNDPAADTVEATVRDMVTLHEQRFVTVCIRAGFWSLDCLIAVWHLVRVLA